MTTVYIQPDRIAIEGHAGDHDVCCMVSTLLNHFLYNAADNYGLRFDSYVTTDAHAVIRDVDVIRQSEVGAVLVDSFIFSLKLLAKDFPENLQIQEDERQLITAGKTAGADAHQSALMSAV